MILLLLLLLLLLLFYWSLTFINLVAHKGAVQRMFLFFYKKEGPDPNKG